MAEWRTIPQYSTYHAALFEGEQLIRVHPIPFDDKREADRAVSRLNSRDDKGGNDT